MSMSLHDDQDSELHLLCWQQSSAVSVYPPASPSSAQPSLLVDNGNEMPLSCA